ncbi:unnamed protein product [Closterium sp. NIES-54]
MSAMAFLPTNISAFFSQSSPSDSLSCRDVRHVVPFPLDDLPDDVLALVLRLVSRRSIHLALQTNLVCKRWCRLLRLSLSHVTITREITLDDLLCALRTFPTITYLDIAENFLIPPFDSPILQDHLVRRISDTCPHLKSFALAHQSRAEGRVSAAGLSALFRGCPRLESLRLLSLSAISALPPAVSRLTNLSALELGDSGAWCWGEGGKLTLAGAEGGGEGGGGGCGGAEEGRQAHGQNFMPNGGAASFPHLDSLPPLGQLKNLRRLTVSLLSKLEELPPSLSLLPNLQTLVIHGCSQIKSLPCNVPSALPCLSSLAILSCCNIQDVEFSSFCYGAMEAFGEGGVEGRVNGAAVKCDGLRCDNVKGDLEVEAERKVRMQICALSGDFSSCTSVTPLRGNINLLSALSTSLRSAVNLAKTEAKARRDLGSNSSFLPWPLKRVCY